MKLKLAIAAVLVIGLGVSQVSTEKDYIWVLIGNRFTLTEVTGLVRNGNVLTVPPAQVGETYKAGQGIIFTHVPGQPTEISVETPAFWMNVDAPLAPGPCPLSVPASDQRYMAQKGGFLYVCVPYPDSVAGTLWKWGRAPLEFAW